LVIVKGVESLARASAAKAVRHRPRARQADTPRAFTDLFAAAEACATGLKCGYLVDPVREGRGG
jgi:hypothetical protein